MHLNPLVFGIHSNKSCFSQPAGGSRSYKVGAECWQDPTWVYLFRCPLHPSHQHQVTQDYQLAEGFSLWKVAAGPD